MLHNSNKFVWERVIIYQSNRPVETNGWQEGGKGCLLALSTEGGQELPSGH